MQLPASSVGAKAGELGDAGRSEPAVLWTLRSDVTWDGLVR